MSPALMPKPRVKPSTVTSTFRAPKALVDQIDREAARIGISRNEAFCQLLKIGLGALDAPKAKPKK